MRPRALGLAALALLVPTRASTTPSCPYPFLGRATYSAGFSSANFSSAINAAVDGSGRVVLVQTPPNPYQLVLPFDEDVTIKFVGQGAGGPSGMLGWHYVDQAAPFLGASGPVDVNADGDFDFLQSPWMNAATFAGAPLTAGGVYWMSGLSTGPDITVPPSYSDDLGGGLMPHVPNLLEGWWRGSGDVVFQLLDDDADLVTQNGAAPQLTLVGDSSASVDSIPDYDVNGDGSIDLADRTVALGQLRGGREMALSYLDYAPGWVTFTDDVGVNYAFESQYAPATWRASNCFPASQTCVVREPIYWFSSKSELNQDFGAVAPNAIVTTIDPSCPFPQVCTAGRRGWLTQTMIDSLLHFDGVTVPSTLVSLQADSRGYSPHVFGTRPANDDLRYLVLGFDGAPLYDKPTRDYFGVTGSNRFFNTAVVLLASESGGSVVSNDLSTQVSSTDCATFGNSCIAAADLGNTTISKIRFRLGTDFPGCAAAPSATTRVDLFYSVDDGGAWHQVVFPTSSPTATVIDVLAQGLSGNHLRWKAHLVTNQLGCTPTITALDVGYEAILGGEYGGNEPLPIANVSLRGTYATRGGAWTVSGGDTSARGHLRMFRLYDPDSLVSDSPPSALWDAGARLASASPDGRAIYYALGGAANPFSATPINPGLAQALIPAPLRGSLDSVHGVRRGGAKLDGQWVYDLDGDGHVDDADAARIVQWMRGWESPGIQRAWPLGAIADATPAIVGPPGHPWWLDLPGTPPSERSAFLAFALSHANRQTLTLAGAADGMLHAFDTGAYHPPVAGAPDGSFGPGNGAAHWYGDGSEQWAFIPSKMLPWLADAVPALRAWKPSSHPRPSLDTAVSVADVATGGAIRTMAVTGGGSAFPFLTAVDVSNATAPSPAWPADWTDPDFNGVTAGPSIGPTLTTAGRAWTVATTSGLASSPAPLYVYVLDAATAATLVKTRLGTGLLDGAAGSPAMVDSDGDGVIDRLYVTDTGGTVWKVDSASGAACSIATLGESIYAPMAVDASTPHKVILYLGGGGRPDTGLTVPATTFHLFSVEDDDDPGTCSGGPAGPAAPSTVARHRLLYANALGMGQQLWSVPIINGSVYFAVSSSARLDVCATATDSLLALDPVTGAVTSAAPPLGIDAVAGLRAYDGHLFVSTLDGGTLLFGDPKWQNALGLGGAPAVAGLPTLDWAEQ